jgi:hypothetical protein
MAEPPVLAPAPPAASPGSDVNRHCVPPPAHPARASATGVTEGTVESAMSFNRVHAHAHVRAHARTSRRAPTERHWVSSIKLLGWIRPRIVASSR